ncbi:MAG: hypothetical protein DRQ55_06550 [Planctomycetota bacterium]|nr:MAG: hypothetical protein DRQ55_06550 [Planctomycetota bacterium]
MRRLLTFLAMVVAGLATVFLLADDPLSSDAGGDSLTGRAGGTDRAMAIGSDDQERDTRVQIGQAEIPIMSEVEVAPGVFEEHMAYSIKMDGARVGADGRYLLENPIITIFDPATDTWRGEVRAQTGVVDTGQSSVGDMQLFLGSTQADAFALTGDVRGRFATPDGEAHLRAERMELRDRTVTAEGPVRWWRDDVSLTGIDMLLDDEAGTLTLQRDAVLTTTGGAGLAGTVHSPDGLLWHLPGESGGRGHGELHGPVTGSGEDGSTFSCARMLADADDGAFTLLGQAQAELPGRWLARGQQLTLAPDASGQLTLEHGLDAHFELREPGREGWLESASLQRDGQDLVSPVPVRIGLSGVAGSAADLRWNPTLGTLHCGADVVLRGSGGRLTDAEVFAPGGMSLNVPLDADDLMAQATGELRGPIRGSLPDGGRFTSQRLVLDGPGNGLTLLGDAHITRADGSELLGARLLLLSDERGRLVDASGRCDLRFLGAPADERLVLQTQWLDLTGGVLSSPLEVHVEQGGLSLEGTGLRFTEASGELDITREAHLRRADPKLPGAFDELDALGGLTWLLPEDRSLGPAAGHGELRGPVTGTTSDGLRVRAARAFLDGPAAEIRLQGDAHAERPGAAPHWLESERFVLQRRQDTLRVTSDTEVRFAFEQLSGSSDGLTYDERTRRLSLRQDALLRVLDEDGRQRMGLACEGELVWVAPAGEDPLLMGHGEARDAVTAVDDTGARFLTDHLVLDGPERTITLLGPSRIEQILPGRTLDLSAVERIVTRRDEAGALSWLQAEGEAHGRMHSPDERLSFDAARVRADLAQGSLVFDGPTHLEREADGDSSSLDGADGSRLVALTDAQGQLASLVGHGGITIVTGSFTALCDTLDWDLPADHVVLDGNCRLLSLAGWVSTDRIELWPEAQRSYIPVPATSIEGGQ